MFVFVKKNLAETKEGLLLIARGAVVVADDATFDEVLEQGVEASAVFFIDAAGAVGLHVAVLHLKALAAEPVFPVQDDFPVLVDQSGDADVVRSLGMGENRVGVPHFQEDRQVPHAGVDVYEGIGDAVFVKVFFAVQAPGTQIASEQFHIQSSFSQR
jgi:hypothetical protein